MPPHIFGLLRGYLAEYGYWTVAAALLLENAGLPVPGETILLLASFLAYSEHKLHLPSIILVGICAATVGDNIGFLIGFYGGRPLLERYRKTLHIQPATIARGEEMFRRNGAVTIFTARFIAGLRVIAGPLAGVLQMPWRKFVLANFLGAALWVAVVSAAGYVFGKHWEKLLRIVKDVNIVLLLAAALLLLLVWRKRRGKIGLSNQN
jgi:membrane protein DedA with SNARE-associated domain